MRRRRQLFAWLLASSQAVAFMVEVAPKSKECFHEHASASDHVQGHFVWAGHEQQHRHDGLRVTVTSPSGDPVYDSSDGEKDGSFDYYATMEGMYTICFANEQPDAAARVTAKITVGDPPDLIQLAKTEHLSPIEERIKSLHESMNAVRDLQDQMREQDEAQAKMTRSTRSWLLYFTLLEALILIGVTSWQNLYLKSFFEVKRVV